MSFQCTSAKAETGAGQHGVATAAACALLDLECAARCLEATGEQWLLNLPLLVDDELVD